MMDALLERAPLVAVAVAVCVTAVLFQSYFSNAAFSGIPFVGAELGGDKARRNAYLKDAKRIYKDAYEKVQPRTLYFSQRGADVF